MTGRTANLGNLDENRVDCVKRLVHVCFSWCAFGQNFITSGYMIAIMVRLQLSVRKISAIIVLIAAFSFLVPFVPSAHSSPPNAPETHYPAFTDSVTWQMFQVGARVNGLYEYQFHNCLDGYLTGQYRGNC